MPQHLYEQNVYSMQGAYHNIFFSSLQLLKNLKRKYSAECILTAKQKAIIFSC